ncbi:STAS/SEC14 domain-containing protein [Arthrobacter sp. ISL-95]|uniref:DUF7793 family protein n=1 Tax=Arthrobacter sp. ISL-95 TaxID=2819116 RepID=UPI001BE8E8FD|nr:STAS/SEC14 domain-containing protein [Arthrobacter sp. ISL-95]MBT2586547.1 STAS/SEC14 domain-containing protein [Arthrobacter sp. ISL-95]
MAATFSDLGKATLVLGADGVLQLAWQRGIRLDGSDVEAAIAKVNEISDGVPRPLLVAMAGVTLSHDRVAFAEPSAAFRIALLGSTPVDWMTATFRGRHTYPQPCPTQFFTDKSEAMKWLLQDPHQT